MTKTEARQIIKNALESGKITSEVSCAANDAISAKSYYGNPMTPRSVQSIIRNRFGL